MNFKGRKVGMRVSKVSKKVQEKPKRVPASESKAMKEAENKENRRSSRLRQKSGK